MNRYLLLTIVCFAFIAVAAGVAGASPSFRGYTGLIRIPDADTLDLGEWDVGVMAEEVDDFDANDIFANYGIADNFEVGFNAFQRVNSNNEDRTTWLNAKYRFAPETCDRPGIAVGIIDVTNSVDTTPYIVLSQSLSGPLRIWNGDNLNIRGHIGLAGGQFDGVFVGFNGYIGNRVDLQFEWDSHDLNVGGKFTLVPGLRVHAAFFDLTGSTDFGVGASYSKFY